ncbi:MAG: S8 family serine peptidase [Ardenticatenales bacterium]|nr:S8 family serine peptidase [Ardenticatenales bacterium]
MAMRATRPTAPTVRIRRALAAAAAIVVATAGAAAGHAHRAPAPRSVAATHRAVVDGRLTAALAAGRPVAALAILEAQADVQAAGALADKAAKGRYVFDRLVEVAEVTQRPLRSLLAQRGVPYRPYYIVNAVAFEADAATVAVVAGQAGVTGIVMMPTFRIDPSWTVDAAGDMAVDARDPAAPDGTLEVAVAERNIKAIGADKVWRQGYLGAGATVAIIDTGVNARHPALAQRYRGRAEGDDYNWLDAVAGQNAPVDVNDHGTHVAGIVLGKQGSREVGVAPEAEWIACRIFAQDRGTTQAILECLQWALAPTKRDGSAPQPDRAPDIVNASWGIFGRLFCDNPFPGEVAIRNLVAAGILFVAASGNDGPRCGSVCPPASLIDAFAVGNYDDERRSIADTSSRGPFVQGAVERIKPDVAAPGENITSTVGTSGFGIKQGTSMAAPHVSGAAALLISARPALSGRPGELRAILEETADPVNADQCGPSGARAFNNAAGHGVIDVEAAVAAALSLPTATPTATDAPRPTATATAAATATGVPSATARATTTPAPTTPGATTSAVATATTEWTPTPRPSVPPPTATRSTPGIPVGRLWLPLLSR